MKISDIYKKYSVTPGLADHMITVTKILLTLKKYWTGEHINWDQIVTAGLLHDIGNIVKFDFDKFPDLLGGEKVNVLFWKKAQQKIRMKYGSDDHLATKAILMELNVAPDLIKIIHDKSFANIVTILKSDKWAAKLLLYSDLRVLPSGIGTIQDRIDDVKTRMPKYAQRGDFPNLINAAFELEKQIQSNLSISVKNIKGKIESTSREYLLAINI